ncbi:TIGR01619 family protein [Rodentibacter trehalosifermentans]|uniref:TIGR01619 family protein n=1 Tax=Rodentibacter trehalosifermentans TaxID=1908263 RepID=A0A1V3IY86_9PAST|nr:TIGR01619 family protein [Rodentibacter trehalosifermentans]OOF47329.1 TIGR01619 family protein [Rodentibacter trehalosifermentans]OOF52857.1 TIGR01619 family protein [Rodentibacter trehalosifermentans]
MDMANWQNYRSMVNDMPAVFTANIENIDQFHGKNCNKIVQFTINYDSDESGLPSEGEYDKLINRIFKTLAQLTALPNVFFAGHFICNGQAKIHFYCEHSEILLETLSQIDFVEGVAVQEDPNWDIYFDFLLASPLEIKMNATEELLGLLQSKGRDLSDTYLVEHSFHFDEEQKMFPFMDELSLGDYSFTTLQYSAQAIQFHEDDEPYYLVKLEQEIPLDNGEIFELVEKFEKLARQFMGDYIGWECDSLMDDNKQLN